MKTETLFLLDRNAVSLIKDAVAGREPPNAKKFADLATLRAIDVPQHGISTLLSIMEGAHGNADSVGEKAACLVEETDAITQFFLRARTDVVHLRVLSNVVAQIFTGLQESQWDERAHFLVKAAPFVVQKVAERKRRDVENELVRLALESGLAANDVIVMFFLSCLYGNDAARRVIKPNKPNAYNVLSDVHSISRVGMVKAAAGQLRRPIKVRFHTLDEGLQGVLQHVGIVRPRFTSAGGLEMQIRYGLRLFPELPAADSLALLQRLEDTAVTGA